MECFKIRLKMDNTSQVGFPHFKKEEASFVVPKIKKPTF